MTAPRERALAWLAHVVGPLGLGGLLYVVARPRGLVFWDWARAARLDAPLLALRGWLGPLLEGLPEWVRYTLPDALWVYALTAAIVRLQRDSSALVRALYLAIPAALGPGAELLQAAGALPGTFDPLDLVATAVALLLGAAPALRLARPATAST